MLIPFLFVTTTVSEKVIVTTPVYTCPRKVFMINTNALMLAAYIFFRRLLKFPQDLYISLFMFKIFIIRPVCFNYFVLTFSFFLVNDFYLVSNVIENKFTMFV